MTAYITRLDSFRQNKKRPLLFRRPSDLPCSDPYPDEPESNGCVMSSQEIEIGFLLDRQGVCLSTYGYLKAR